MALNLKQISQARNVLEHCTRPIYFFHDDPDGLCSFLLLYRKLKEGKGVVLKTTPRINEFFIQKVKDYQADKVIVVDIANVDQEFIDQVGVPVLWIDHHGPYERERVLYINPRLHGANVPASYCCWQIVNQDLWLAALGCIADWHVPDFFETFRKEYPDLVGEASTPPSIMFTTKLGLIIKMLSLILKGPTSEVMRCVKILTRVNSPYELLDEQQPAMKYLYKRFRSINKGYEALLKDAKKAATKDKILCYVYHEGTMALTKELSNELLFHYPEKIIIAGREKGGEFKVSLRASTVNIKEPLERALQGIDGYGGGHEYACGAVVKKDDFERFLFRFRQEINHNL